MSQPTIDGYVLAGGQSSRMGQDKALLQLNNRTLLQIALEKLTTICGNATILCGSRERAQQLASYGRCITDRRPNSGPLSGIDAALHDATTDSILIIPVDTPLLTVELMHRLLQYPAACFIIDDQVQPLPVTLPRTATTLVANALAEQTLKLVPLFRQLGVTILPTQESNAFTNVNTPADFETLRQNQIR